MDILNPRSLREKAHHALARGREPKKLIAAYAAGCFLLSAVLAVANYWLDGRISGTGGLGNLGSRAMFSTAQQILPMVSAFLGMCLELGYLSGMMRIVRGRYADHTDLKEGFRKFWPLLRLGLLQGLVYVLVAVLAAQLGSMLFLFTPWAEPLMEVLMPIAASGVIDLNDAALADAVGLMIPMLLFSGAAMLLALIPFLYRFRFANYCLLDDPKGSALGSMRESGRLMRRRFGAMLKLDIALWPYHLANVLVGLLLYGDLILALLEIPVPLEAEVLSLVVYALALVAQALVQLGLRNRTESTYVMAYEQLREKPGDTGVVLGNIFDM